MPNGPRGRPAVPGDCGPAPRARGLDQLSRAACAWVRGPPWSTSGPGRLGPGSEGRWCEPTLAGASGSFPRSRGQPAVPHVLGRLSRAQGVNQLSLATGARVQRPLVSTICPWRFALKSVFPQGRPTAPGDWGPGPSARRFNQLSCVTQARVRGPAVAISCLAQLGSGAEVPLCRPAVPHDLGLFSRAQVVNQLSLATHTQVPGPAGLTSPPRRITHWSDSPRVRPGLPGETGPCLRA